MLLRECLNHCLAQLSRLGWVMCRVRKGGRREGEARGPGVTGGSGCRQTLKERSSPNILSSCPKLDRATPV